MNYLNWSEESEQSVIGSLLKDSYKMPEIIEIISSDDFFHIWHKNIFRAMELLHEDNKPIDVTTVINQLGKLLDDSGGMSYLAEMAANTPSARNVIAYAHTVKDTHQVFAGMSPDRLGVFSCFFGRGFVVRQGSPPSNAARR